MVMNNFGIRAFSLLIVIQLATGRGCHSVTNHLRGDNSPTLHFDSSVAADLRVLADETWLQFYDAFAASTSCIGDVTLRASRTITERASYDPETATILVKVPAPSAVLQGALIHEWAHHVEHQCPSQSDMRADFLVAQGYAATISWFDGPSWEETPSEQYAEAAILVVLGERPVPTTVRVSPEAVQVLAAWAEGR